MASGKVLVLVLGVLSLRRDVTYVIGKVLLFLDDSDRLHCFICPLKCLRSRLVLKF